MSKSSKGNAEAVRAVVTSWRSIARRKIHDLSLLDAFGWHLKGTTMLDAIYLCIVSQFNLPEYESCLKRQPEQILLVVSDEMSTRIATERLYLKLQTALPNSNPDLGNVTTTNMTTFELVIHQATGIGAPRSSPNP